ncbi:MAG: hypothetical protein QXW06_04635 [Thermoplasmata archaeon]
MRKSVFALSVIIALALTCAGALPTRELTTHWSAPRKCSEGHAQAGEAVGVRGCGEEFGRPSHDSETSSPGGTLAIFLHCNITESSVSLNASAADQLVVLTGKVTVDYINVLAVSVSLRSSVDLGWPSAVQPTEMSFNAPGSLPFTVNVTVPGGTQNRSAVLTVRATATIQGLPSDSDQDTATIEVGLTAQLPVVPPTEPQPRSEGEVRLLNMPAIVAGISLLAVIGAFLALRFRHPKGRGGKARPQGKLEGGRPS